MAYIKRDPSYNIIAWAPAEASGYEYIDDNDQELINWKTALDAELAGEATQGFTTLKSEDTSKVFIMELANQMAGDIALPQSVRDAAQDVIDKVR